MIKVKDSDEFKRLVTALADDVVYAHVHWKLARDVGKSLRENPIVLAQSGTFWGLTLLAHEGTAVQRLCRAYDQQPQALSLHSWLKTIRVKSHLFDKAEFRKRLAGNAFVESLAADVRQPDAAVLSTDIRECSDDDPLVKKLLKYRNNIGAHRSAGGAVTGTSGNFALPHTVVETLLDRARTVLNRYSQLFAAEVHSVNMIGRDDYQFIVSSVTEAVERSRAQTQALLKEHFPDQATE